MGNYWYSTHSYGWKPDKEDSRDLFYRSTKSVLPSALSLRGNMPPVLDQGQLGSCTANAICNAFRFDEMKQNLANIERSRLFLYYNERVIDGDVNSDSGATIRDGMKSVNSTGICSNEEWPYDITKFMEKPLEECYIKAKPNHSIRYQRVNQNLVDMKNSLLDGYPIIIGFRVYASMETSTVTQSGNVPLPQPDEQLLGEHAILLTGYDDDKKVFHFQNSWGEIWGDKGYGSILYDYVTNPDYASDFWIMETIIESENSKKRDKMIYEKWPIAKLKYGRKRKPKTKRD